MHHVYILRCSDRTLYVGSTRDLERRLETHNAGRGAAYTARRRPVALVYAEAHDSLEAALRRERQIKGWTREKKEALVAGDLALLKRLSKRRHHTRAETRQPIGEPAND